jgi:hypothetical protein
MLNEISIMKPTCITYTTTNEYNIEICGFHQTIKK